VFPSRATKPFTERASSTMRKSTIPRLLTIGSVFVSFAGRHGAALALAPGGDPPPASPSAPEVRPDPSAAGPTPVGAPVTSPAPTNPKVDTSSATETPPLLLATREKQAAAAPESWFSRTPLTLSVGEGKQQWRATIYGFVQVDAMQDSTRSYADSIGSALVARNETYAGQVGRTQFSIRNTRLGFALESPIIGGVAPSAVLEGDFFGNQPNPPATSEGTFFNSPIFRIRHAYFELKNDYIDVLAGQTYYLFGWQNYFFPCTVQYLGLPNEAFGRTAQVRLSHTFRSEPVNVDIAVAGLRPAQSDSEIPDGNAGLRMSLNHWKGISTPGNGGTGAFPLSLGVSGTVRQFKVDAFTPPPPQSSNSTMGWGVSIDALIPIIPGKDANDRGNRLTITGSVVKGTGIADLVNAGGGAAFPTLPNPAQISPAPLYTPDVDNALVTFNDFGILQTIDWQTFMVGLQYYLPPTGRVILSGNFTEGYSPNMASLYRRGGLEINLLTRVAQLSRYADANVFFDVTPAVRVAASFQYTATEYVDGEIPRNLRWMGSGLYFF
jgi:hypothetical protein